MESFFIYIHSLFKKRITMKFILSIPVLLFALCSYGQSKKISCKVGQEYELTRDAYRLCSWANDRDDFGFVSITQNTRLLKAVQFDLKSLNIKSEADIKTSDLPKNRVNEMNYVFDKNNYWIYSDWDKKSQKELLYAVDLGAMAKTGSATPKLLMENPRLTGVVKTTGTFVLNVHGKYKFARDAEKKLLLVTCKMFSAEKDDKLRKDKIGHAVFDENMNKIWSAEFIMPYTKSVMNYIHFAVDKKGNAYVLVKVYDSDSRKEINESTGKSAFHFEILKFTADGKMSQVAIATDSYGIGEIYFSENQNHEIAIAFTYTNNFEDNDFKGIFIATLDKNGKLNTAKSGFHDFAQIITNEKRSGSFTPENLLIQNLLFEKDGSVLVTCEVNYIEKGLQQASPTSNQFSRNFNIYHYGNILACRLNKDGNFEWIKTIRKDQYESTFSSEALGFTFFSDPQGYYFLYLDHKKNATLPTDGTPYKYNVDYSGQLVVCRIDKAGSITREVLFANKAEDILIQVTCFTKVGKDWYTTCLTKNGDLKPLSITVND